MLQGLEAVPMWQWGEGAKEFLLQTLASEVAEFRARAAALCGELVDEEVAEALLERVASDDAEEVASEAAIALGPALEECSLDYFLDEPSEFDDLYESDLPLSRETYQRVLRQLEANHGDSSRPDGCRRRCAEAAVRAQAPWVEAKVPEMMRCDDIAWQLTGVFCMGYLQGFDEQILEIIEGSDEELKREAVLAAGNRELNKAVAPIVRLANDEDCAGSMRLAAIHALGQLTGQRSRNTLERLAGHEDPEIAEAADCALKESLTFPDLADDDLI
jgi:hypothetical protein